MKQINITNIKTTYKKSKKENNKVSQINIDHIKALIDTITLGSSERANIINRRIKMLEKRSNKINTELESLRKAQQSANSLAIELDNTISKTVSKYIEFVPSISKNIDNQFTKVVFKKNNDIEVETDGTTIYNYMESNKK